MAEMTIQDLYKLFEDNNLSPNNSNVESTKTPQQKTNTNIIKIGDIVVASFKDREFRGEVSKVLEKNGVEQYDIKVGTTIISVKFDNILEHYPKNTKFEQPIKKDNIKEIHPEEIIQETKKIDIPLQTQVKPKTVVTTPPPVQKPVDEKKTITTIQPTLVEENKNEPKKIENGKVSEDERDPKKVRKSREEVEEEENKKNPENTNFTTETVKMYGKIAHFSGSLKLNEVIDFLANKGIDKEKCWYFITEKNGELHLIRNNDKGFQIQPFVISFVDLKIKDKLTESKEQIKIVGNNHFSIISNIPQSVYELTKNGLIALLSQTKK